MRRFVRAGHQVLQAANRAWRAVGRGRGAVHGTRVHTEFSKQVRQISKGRLHPEVAYRNVVRVNQNTPSSIRVDVVRGNPNRPKEIYDLKTGNARLTPKRVEQIRRHLPKERRNIPIREVRQR